MSEKKGGRVDDGPWTRKENGPFARGSVLFSLPSCSAGQSLESIRFARTKEEFQRECDIVILGFSDILRTGKEKVSRILVIPVNDPSGVGQLSRLRQDTLTGRWVIVAEDRQGRPNEFGLPPLAAADPRDCPFCPGHEDRTTAEILATGRGSHGDRSDWRVRVFPNMFPALGPENDLPDRAGSDLFPVLPGQGGHEVVVYTPDHDGSLASLAGDHLAELLQVIRDRMIALAGTVPGVRHVLPFCNHGPRAGATLAHPHLQILAAPLVPALVREKAVNLARYQERTGRCLLCDTLAAEQTDGQRIVATGGSWIGWAPWASRFPFEMRFASRDHASSMTAASDADLADLARVLQTALARLEQIHENPSYNVIFHSGALGIVGSSGGEAAAGPGFHWHVEVLPRLARLAGFEAGSGFAINSIPPETAASRLRGEG